MEPDTDHLDPIYEPSYIAFAYGAWATTSWAASNEIGLFALVGAALVIALTGIRTPVQVRSNSFLVDFASMLLFCSASIAAAVLGVEALVAWPGWSVPAAAIVAGTALLGATLRSDKAVEAGQ